MRIGLSCSTIEPVITHGKVDGIGIETQNLYEEFIKLNQTVIPCSFPHAKSQLVSAFPNGEFFKFSYGLSTLADLALPISLHRNIEKNIDLFHATDHMIPKLKNTPVVATLNDAVMFHHPEWHKVKLGYIKKLIRKKTLDWADHYITISNAMVTEIMECKNIKAEKISVVYLGISPFWFEEASAEEKHQVLAKYHLPKNFLLFAGTLQHKKNLPRLIRAYLQLPQEIQTEYPLIIVGRAGLGHQESLAAVDELIAQKKGQWLNYVSNKELRTLFQCATLYVHPTLHEGFGLTVLEAFAAKTPVLTSNVAALPEITAGAAYLIDPLSITEITDGIKKLLLNETLRNSLIMKGALRVQDFSWKKCAENTLKVYRSLV